MPSDSTAQALQIIGATAIALAIGGFIIVMILGPISIDLAAKLLQVPGRSVLKAIGSWLGTCLVPFALGALFWVLPDAVVAEASLFLTVLASVANLLVGAVIIAGIYNTTFFKSLGILLLSVVLATVATTIVFSIMCLGAVLFMRSM